MNIVKHMEAAFLVVVSVAGAASVAVDAIPAAQARVAPAAVAVAQPARAAQSYSAAQPMAVVHVSAKRMSAAEKQASLARERAGQPI